jgi:benzoyl-CoA reductase/2-hydroxyglutaryl-CoA dehydratase subunit BcrC/BadD/HgdB
MKILSEFDRLARSNYNEYLEEEKNKGRKIIGYMCSYVPEEIIHASGFTPYRLKGVESKGTAQGDVYYSSLNCTFVRHTFDKALRGEFKFIDGMIFMNGCDHTRRMYDNWRHAELGPDFIHMFITPHKISTLAEERFTDEINLLKEKIEHHFNIEITNEALTNSINLYNKKRSLIAELYESRKNEKVPLKGSEILSVIMAVSVLPVEIAIKMLEELKIQIKGRDVMKKDDLRIFLSSGCIEEIDHIQLIEENGAVIVADNICLGTKHFNLNTDNSIEPVHALANRYLNHLSCPRMMNDFKRRLNHLHKIKEEYKIDAIIAEKLKFCDLWGGETYLYRKESKKNGYPILSLERELYGGGEGQIKTRIQAFFEQVKNKNYSDNDLARFSGKNYKAI